MLLCLALTSAAALLTPPQRAPLTRRTALFNGIAASSFALAQPAPVEAAVKGGVQWSLDVPEAFAVQRQLSSIVRVKREPVLQAEDEATGATIKLLLLPFGQQAGASLDADEQFKIASFVYNGEGSPSDVGKTMITSAARSPGILKLTPQGAVSDFQAADGRRYVRYGYVAERCSGEIDSGECYGSTSKRRTLAALTMSPISQYRTNTERERMQAAGQARNVDVLWLLTCSAPDGAAWAKLEPTFEKIVASLTIPVAPAVSVS